MRERVEIAQRTRISPRLTPPSVSYRFYTCTLSCSLKRNSSTAKLYTATIARACSFFYFSRVPAHCCSPLFLLARVIPFLLSFFSFLKVVLWPTIVKIARRRPTELFESESRFTTRRAAQLRGRIFPFPCPSRSSGNVHDFGNKARFYFGF